MSKIKFVFIFALYLSLIFVSPCFATAVLNDITVSIADVIKIANAAMGGLAVTWGLRKAVKFINRS